MIGYNLDPLNFSSDYDYGNLASTSDEVRRRGQQKRQETQLRGLSSALAAVLGNSGPNGIMPGFDYSSTIFSATDPPATPASILQEVQQSASESSFTPSFAEVGQPGNEMGTTGKGDLSWGDAGKAFFSGATKGLSGQAVDSLFGLIGMDPTGIGGKAARGAAKMGMAPFGMVPKALDAFIGGLKSLAEAARKSQDWNDLARLPEFAPQIEVYDNPDIGDPTADAAPPEGLVSMGFGGVAGTPGSIGEVGEVGEAGGLGEGSGASGPGGSAAWEHGGPVYGPEGIDKVRGRLTRGEFVIDRDSARRFMPLLRVLNEWEPR
jgi:hypothetical protein